MKLQELDYSILQQCMHCGMCLPTCPTYAQTLKETSSPRGRIALLRAIADGRTEAGSTLEHEMSFCLGCMACETACPAGVQYTPLLEAGRAEVGQYKKDFFCRLFRTFLLRGPFFHLTLMRAIGQFLHAWQVSGLQDFFRSSGISKLLPERLRGIEKLTPTASPCASIDQIEEFEKSIFQNDGRKFYRVAMLTGCVQDVLFAEINRDTVDVLKANRCEIWTPTDQGCCGSLHAHLGEEEWAKELARRQIDLFLPEQNNSHQLDAIITNAAGCGSHLKHYARLLKGDARYHSRALLWDSLVRDIQEFLVEIDFRKPTSSCSPQTRLTYHEACHLCHGQKITTQPRKILKALPGFEFVELAESTWCCGSAGVYNLLQPQSAEWLLERKMSHIAQSGATVIATANPGCLIQLQKGCAEKNLHLRIIHPISLLAQAYRAEFQSFQ